MSYSQTKRLTLQSIIVQAKQVYVMVLSGYIPASPTILLKLQHTVAMVAAFTYLGFVNQSQPNPMDPANGGPQSHHLH